MRAALLHYWMINNRGGEKVLTALGELLPDADIFTHAFGEKMREDWGGSWWHAHRVKESFVARLPCGRRHPQVYLPLMPFAERRLDFSKYDLIVSSESGPIKGIRKPAHARHICYCHTPMRYLWDMREEYFRSADWKGKLAMRMFLRYLQKEDLRSADSVDTFVANSNFVADRIRRIYGRESTVVYPPVDIEFFGRGVPDSEAASDSGAPFGRGDYYLFAGHLTSYKKPDVAVQACHRLGRRLVVAGDGDMLGYLRGFDHPGLKVVGRVTDAQLLKLYANARALIFPGVEDFGIIPVEAQAAGIPVIAYGEGGVLETVVDRETGLLYREPSVESLCAAIEEFESLRFVPDVCRANARRFDRPKFMTAMRGILFG